MTRATNTMKKNQSFNSNFCSEFEHTLLKRVHNYATIVLKKGAEDYATYNADKRVKKYKRTV